MFEYKICTVPDEDIFYKQCAALEKHIAGLEKGKRLQDVDGTLIQTYTLHGQEITVLNDMALRSVHIESELDLEQFFPQ